MTSTIPASSDRPAGGGVAFVSAGGPPPDALDGQTPPTLYSRDKLGRLDEDVRDGRVRRVRFESEAMFWEGVWDGDLSPAAWRSVGIVPETADGQPVDLQLFDWWAAWDRRRRRRQTIAGTIISVVVLAAAFALNHWAL